MNSDQLLDAQGRLGTVVSCLLGFVLYGRIVHFARDFALLRSLFARRKVLSFLTRTTYFVARTFIVAYLLVAVIYNDHPRHLSCRETSDTVVVLLFVMHVANHWLFMSRLLAIWHTHACYRSICAYVMVTFTVICTMTALNYHYTSTFIALPLKDCMLLLDRLNQQGKRFRVASCVCDFVFHTINVLLTILRLSTFRDNGGAIDDTTITWDKFRSTCNSLLHKHSKTRFTLARDLAEQGIEYWIARTVLLVGLVCVPTVVLNQNPLAFMACLSVFITLDVELSGALYRTTVDAAYTSRSTELNLVTVVDGAPNTPSLPSVSRPSPPPNGRAAA